jgi:predicted  nucleic acid-binding Zn-ribbon protein
MAKLDAETTEVINWLKQESLNLVDEASALEFKIFERFGETEQTLTYMDEMKNVEEEAIALYSRLSTLHLQVARSQPISTPATLELLDQAIQRTKVRIPALERSIQEVKTEWNLL